jgi:hypothetical protein
MTHFNIEMIIIDYAGYQFLESANESELFRKAGINVKIFDFTSERDGAELDEQLKIARNGYNKVACKIAFSQYFTTDFIRKANEWLQYCIDYKKIWFGAGLKANGSKFSQAMGINLDKSLVGLEAGEDNSDLIDKQEILIKQTKYQASSIIVKTTTKGVQSFDLPQMMKRDTSITRMRRDSYTTLMLVCWAMKCYNDIMQAPAQEAATFVPEMI